MPPAPPQNPALLATPEPLLTTTGDPKVDAYRDRLLSDYGADWRAYLTRLLAGVRADPKIIEDFDRLAALREPKDYIDHYVTPERIRRGREQYRKIKADRAPTELPPEVRVALWGMLADYGERKPRRDVLQALLVLGAYGRGDSVTNFPLHHAAALVISGAVTRGRLLAYETGRIGQPQISPDRFEGQARDGNGDGKADIWADRRDILASLTIGDPSQFPGVPIHVAVKPARFDMASPAEARMAHALDQPYNVPTGILRRWDGKPWSDEQRNWSGTYVEPYGSDGPAFLMLMPAWPVNSLNPVKPRYFDHNEDWGFALAVGLLADAIAGRPVPPLPNG